MCLYSADFTSTPPTAPPWRWTSPFCLSHRPTLWASFWPMVKKSLYSEISSLHCLDVSYWRCLLISPGSVGDAESTLSPDVYVSDDGGYSWLLALKGPHHYAILDSGGLLVAVEHTNSPVNQIKWIYLIIRQSLFYLKFCIIFSFLNMCIYFFFFFVLNPQIFHRRRAMLAYVQLHQRPASLQRYGQWAWLALHERQPVGLQEQLQ